MNYRQDRECAIPGGERMLLNEDQAMVRDMARRFAAERLAPR